MQIVKSKKSDFNKGGYLIVQLTVKPFEYFEPRSIKEAISLLEKYGEDAKVIAGGTDLVPQLKEREIEPKYLIDIKGINDLDHIKDDEGNLRIGAVTTHSVLENSSIIMNKATALAEAVKGIGTVQIRNLGTIGGNLVNASPCADTAPPLVVLEASLNVVGPLKERLVPIGDFFISVNKTVLQKNELLTEIQIPRLPQNSRSAFIKIGRRVGFDLAISSAAVMVTMDGAICKDIRIALGSCAPIPLRVRKAEDFLRGKRLEEKVFEEASEIVAKEISPGLLGRISPRGFSRAGSAEYRIEVSKVLVKNAIKTAVSRRS
ncbi:MAG: xanthine dehydrogenase family protein subunit M [Candidatus Bathyarchaeota archaeon]